MKLTCVRLDWAANPLKSLTKGEWEAGVLNTIRVIGNSGFKAGRAVFQAMERTGKTVRLTPWSEQNPLAKAVKESEGLKDGRCPSGLNNAGAKADGPDGTPRDAAILFNAQDWVGGFKTADSTLLHECVHALRSMAGIDDVSPLKAPFPELRHWKKEYETPTAKLGPNSLVPEGKETRLTQVYNIKDDFYAILVENIYRSERGQGLIRDHLPPQVKGRDVDTCRDTRAEFRWAELAPELSNARNFLAVWRQLIERMVLQQRVLCDQLAAIDCHFNPIFEVYDQKGYFLPGGRQVSSTR